MRLEPGVELNIVEALWMGGYTLSVKFSDGHTVQVDFEPFLSASPQPDVRKYLDIERFKGFRISYGNLVWNDYDLCFPIEDIYSGCLVFGQEQQTGVAEDPPAYGNQ